MYFWSFIFIFCISLIFTLCVCRIALFFQVKPHNDYRRQQKGNIALWGGLSLYLTLAVGYLIWPQEQLLSILVSASILLVVGLLDDLHELKALTKFIGQCAAALLWLYLHDGANILMNAGLPSFLSLSISTLWIVGLCNAFNLIDGSDGQCSMVALLGFAMIGLAFPTLVPISVIFVGTIAGFLALNLPPAKIYLGEGGSTLLGFCLATMTLSLPAQTYPVSVILGVLFLVAFPLTDTVLAIARRKLQKRPLFAGDKDHIHHLLQKLGFSKLQVLMIVSFIVLIGDLTAYNLFQMTNLSLGLILTLTNAALMCFLLYGLHFTKKIAGQKISYFGTSLLEKHILPLNQESVDLNCKKAYLIDLLPYYSELQSRGISTIVNFVKEIAHQIGVDPRYHLVLVGSYSVAVIYRDGSTWQENEIQKINQDFKNIFLNFEVLRSLSDNPEGLIYFDKKNINELLELIPEVSAKSKQVSLQVAS